MQPELEQAEGSWNLHCAQYLIWSQWLKLNSWALVVGSSSGWLPKIAIINSNEISLDLNRYLSSKIAHRYTIFTFPLEDLGINEVAGDKGGLNWWSLWETLGSTSLGSNTFRHLRSTNNTYRHCGIYLIGQQ